MTPAEKKAKQNRVKDISRKLDMRKGKRGFEANVREIEAEVKKLKKELEDG